MVKLSCFSIVLVIIFCSTFLNVLNAQTVMTFKPSKDNTLYETNVDGSLKSNGEGQQLFGGRVGTLPEGDGKIRRALLAFDVSAIPSGSRIDSVALTLNMNKGPSAFSELIELYWVTADWGEGSSDAPAEEGKGASPQNDDATWVHSFFDTTLWVRPGGDFAAGVSAGQNVGVTGPYTWGSTAQMLADVQDWVDNPSGNFGWILIGNENTTSTVKRFASKDNPVMASQPALTVKFTDPTSVEGTDGLPIDFRLAQNFPNPFNPSTVINYTIPQSLNSLQVKLEIFNLLGQKVITLVDAKQVAGEHSIQWDGKNEAGNLVASGVYLYRLKAENFVEMSKMMFIR